MLLPNNKQNTKFFQNAGTARFAYNWAISRIKEYYKKNERFIGELALRKEFTNFKKDNLWLYSYPNNVTKQAIKDAVMAFSKFFKGLSNYPNFKKKSKTTPSFYCDTCVIEFSDTYVKLEKISNTQRKNRVRLNWVKLAEKGKIPLNTKYYNPRITFDGLHWFISVGIEKKEKLDNKYYTEGIGIDLGIKKLLTCSNGKTYENINKSLKVKKIIKKKKRLQKSLSRKYQMNKKGESWQKTESIKKLEKKTLKLDKRLTNIRKDHLYKSINDILNQKPRFINIENLNTKGMMKNKKLSKHIFEATFYKIKQILSYKCAEKGISLRIIDRWFPSSKMCSKCGSIKKDLKLKNRIYICDNCNLVIDRDYNASINILNYKF